MSAGLYLAIQAVLHEYLAENINVYQWNSGQKYESSRQFS